MNENRLSKVLNRIFHIVFLLCFGATFVCILLAGFKSEKLGYSTKERLLVILGFVILLAVITGVYIFIQKFNTRPKIKVKRQLTDKHIKIIIFSVAGVMLAIQLLMGYLLQMEPVTDMRYLNRYSMDFAKTGNFDLIQQDCEKGSVYLIRYPNNFAIVFLLSFIYRIGYLIFGYIPTWLPVVFNAFAINIAVILTVFTAKKLFGNRKAIFVLALCFFFAPYYTYVPYYYTDSISMPFCVASIYLFVCAVKSDTKYKKYILMALCGVFTFIGFKLKGSIIILLAVAIVYLVLKFGIKKILCFSLALIVGFGSINVAYSAIFNSMNIVTEEQSDKYEYPVTHWIMMGLKGLGHYNLEDSQYTQSFPTKEEKQEANIEVIKERIEDFGVSGLISHIASKVKWTWEDGTYYISHHIEKPIRENILHEFVLNNGEYHLIFYIYSCGFQLFLLFMICVSIFKGCMKPEINLMTFLKGIVFACLIFFIIWETRSRYLYNFTPIFILLSADGMDYMVSKLKFAKNKLLKRKTQ